MEANYETMLECAYASLPEVQKTTGRFEIPKVAGHIQGNKTVINNFHAIADIFNRPVEHLLKYILKELATPGELKKNGVIMGTKISATRINEKIEKYAEKYVICRECKKPDTQLSKESGFIFIKCLACGAKHTVQ